MIWNLFIGFLYLVISDVFEQTVMQKNTLSLCSVDPSTEEAARTKPGRATRGEERAGSGTVGHG